jgi:hypothetical protein
MSMISGRQGNSIATILPIISLVLMVFKPTLWGDVWTACWPSGFIFAPLGATENEVPDAWAAGAPAAQCVIQLSE